LSARWASIVAYGEFWDIPRLMVVRWRRENYLLDGPFDDKLDEYSEEFAVYRLPRKLPDLAGSWNGLAATGQYVGEIAAGDLIFDATKRKLVDGAVFDSLRPRPPR
jgi:hypothetical protein